MGGGGAPILLFLDAPIPPQIWDTDVSPILRRFDRLSGPPPDWRDTEEEEED